MSPRISTCIAVAACTMLPIATLLLGSRFASDANADVVHRCMHEFSQLTWTTDDQNAHFYLTSEGTIKMHKTHVASHPCAGVWGRHFDPFEFQGRRMSTGYANIQKYTQSASVTCDTNKDDWCIDRKSGETCSFSFQCKYAGKEFKYGTCVCQSKTNVTCSELDTPTGVCDDTKGTDNGGIV